MSDEATTGDAPEAPVPPSDQPEAAPTADTPDVAESLASIAAALGHLNQRIERLEHPEAVPPPAPAEPEALPEGTTRFFSPIRELAIMYENEDQAIIDGQVVTIKASFRGTTKGGRQKYVQFVGGVYDCTDAELAAYLRSLPAFGQDYWEDPAALRRIGGTVLSGVRGAPEDTGVEPALSAVIPA